MKMKRSRLSQAVLQSLIIGAGLGFASQAMAQQPSVAAKPDEKPAKAEKVDRIEVTGSRITSPTLESVSPLTVIDAAAIKVEGQRSAENLLNNLPQVFATQGSSISNGASGTATVDLRGFGIDRTLVLVNGKRLPYGSANIAAADLNQIPAPLIKRVEVLTGGAGAVYGSDAVAGVVNFIMNDSFQGVQVDMNQSFYQHNQQGSQGVADIVRSRAATNPREFAVPGDKNADGKIFDISLLMGSNFANNKGNATVYFGYKKEDALLQSERDFSACSLSSSAAGFACGGSGTNATGRITNLTTNVVYTNADGNGTARRYSGATDAYNFGPLNYFQRPSERYSANVFAKYDVFPNARLYSEFSFMDYSSVAQIAPGGAFGTVAEVRGDNPLLSDSWRSALGLTSSTSATNVVVQRRNVEGGGRQSTFGNTFFRTLVGLKGSLANWNYDAFFLTSKVAYQQNEQNYFSSTRLARALDVVNVNGAAACRSAVDGSDTRCVPYNVWRNGGVTKEQLDYLQIPGVRSGGTQQQIQGGSIDTDLGIYGLQSPMARSGVALAMGFERRTDKLNLVTDGATQAGDLSGSGGPTPPLPGGKLSVFDIFAEVRAPLIEGAQFADLLSVNASYRQSKYDTDIKTNTYGLGIEWAPNKFGKLRGTYQKAVRAANIIELYTAQGLALYDNNFDPCAGSVVGGRAAGGDGATFAQCAFTGVTAAQFGNIQDSPAGQYNYLQGGNPKLTPEKAKSYTAGIVLTPIQSLGVTFDYFDIQVDDTIDIVAPVTTLNACLANGDPSFCSQITRDRLGTLWLLDEARIIGTNVNIGETRRSGWDFGINYTQKLVGYGSLNLNVVSTLLTRAETEPVKGYKDPVKGDSKYDCVGYWGNTCGIPTPKWRHKSRLTWLTPWNADLSLTWRYIGSVKQDTTMGSGIIGEGSNPVDNTLGARNYFDLSGSWAFAKQYVLRVGINNLLDKDPPITSVSGPTIYGNGNTFPQVYDALGRKVFFNLTAKF